MKAVLVLQSLTCGTTLTYHQQAQSLPPAAQTSWERERACLLAGSGRYAGKGASPALGKQSGVEDERELAPNWKNYTNEIIPVTWWSDSPTLSLKKVQSSCPNPDRWRHSHLPVKTDSPWAISSAGNRKVWNFLSQANNVEFDIECKKDALRQLLTSLSICVMSWPMSGSSGSRLLFQCWVKLNTSVYESTLKLSKI